MKNINPELALQVLLASYEEANEYLRDTSRRMEEQVKFYLTGATALLGAMTVPFAVSGTAVFAKLVLVLGLGILFIFGLVTFLRIISIKSQATHYTAWCKGIEYSAYWVAYNGHSIVKFPKTLQASDIPFSNQIIFLLTLFLVGNSVFLGILSGILINIILDILDYIVLTSITSTYIVPSFLIFVISFYLHRKYLNKRYNESIAKYDEVLKACLHIPLEAETDIEI